MGWRLRGGWPWWRLVSGGGGWQGRPSASARGPVAIAGAVASCVVGSTKFRPAPALPRPFSRPQAPRKAQAQQRAAAATSTIAAAAEQPRSPRSNKQQAAGDGAGELHSQLTTLARSRPRSSNAPRRRQAVRGQRVGRRLKRRGTPAVPAQRLGRRRVPTWWANAPGASPLGSLCLVLLSVLSLTTIIAMENPAEGKNPFGTHFFRTIIFCYFCFRPVLIRHMDPTFFPT